MDDNVWPVWPIWPCLTQFGPTGSVLGHLALFVLVGPLLALFCPVWPGLTPFWTVLLKNKDKPMFKDNSKKKDKTKETPQTMDTTPKIPMSQKMKTTKKIKTIPKIQKAPKRKRTQNRVNLQIEDCSKVKTYLYCDYHSKNDLWSLMMFIVETGHTDPHMICGKAQKSKTTFGIQRRLM